MKNILIVILCVVILAVGGYIVYNKYQTAVPFDNLVNNEDYLSSKLFDKDGAELIKVNVNKEFNLGLEVTPSTGYSWNVDFDDDFIQQIGSHFISAEAVDIVGASGQQIFTFKALLVGETLIKVRYSRPWESVQPIVERTFKIIISR